MTGYVKTTTDNQFVEYPYGAEELMRDNPGLGYTYYSNFLEIFPNTDAYKIHGFRLQYVEIDADPVYDGNTQTVSRSPEPFVRDGKWVFAWDVRDLTPEEIANMEKMRAEMKLP
jgi:hypothetical protein